MFSCSASDRSRRSFAVANSAAISASDDSGGGATALSWSAPARLVWASLSGIDDIVAAGGALRCRRLSALIPPLSLSGFIDGFSQLGRGLGQRAGLCLDLPGIVAG